MPPPPRLPPTFLRTTLLTNQIIGNVTVNGGGVVINSNGNAFAIGNSAYITNIGSGPLPTDIIGNVTAAGNVSANLFIGNGALLTGIEQYVLPGEITADLLGNVTATGNVSAEYFLGNGSLLSGIEQYVLPGEITADVFGNVTATGNVQAEYFLGNGAFLTDVQAAIPGEITADVFGNVTASGNVSAEYFLGNGTLLSGVASLNSSGMIQQTNLNGYLTIPQGYVANTAVRLALGGGALPVGSLARQVDDGNSYLLTDSPSNINANWLQFTGVNFPVNTVFGRVGDILATFGDYTDAQIQLYANVGPVQAGNALTEALAYLNESIQPLPGTGNIDIVGNVTAPGNVIVSGQVNALGNVVAPFFVGNGALLTNVQAAIPSEITADVFGNVTATGNVSAEYFLGNGALLSGISTALPSTANIDIRGNVIGSFSNVTTLIGTTGNVGNVIMLGGNLAMSGQINALGNIVAPFFLGNGALLSGISTALPSTANIDIRGNVIATGNVSAAYFLGNGALLSGMQMGPSVSVFFGNSAQQSIPNNSNTTPLYSNVIYDTTSGYSVVTRTYTPGVAGYYQVNGSASWDGTIAAGILQLHLLKNGTRVKTLFQTASSGVTSTARSLITSGSYTIYMSDTDNMTVAVSHNMGNTQNINSGLDTAFSATLIAK